MNGLIEWAQARPIKNQNQKDLLVFLAGKADAAGAAPATKAQIIAGCPDIGTAAQADRALRGLMDASLISSRYDMNTYSHIYTVHAL